ncbi:LHY protein [Quillaja saponaria]|uniref:LHY protein n=1 Tax=Quillaja saponaria TaxID=32244 RepID=A0AAD7L514_QUISA|nr:LHY protein [Quillaja saponaria]
MDAYSSIEDVVTKARKPYTITKQRERWTDEEHNRFLEALKLYGRAWQRIEEHIGTKTAVQIRSHAQKFFSKLEKESLVKGVPIGKDHDVCIPPPRPKRKPSNPYPRKSSFSISTSQIGVTDGKIIMSVSSSHSNQALDLEKEPLPEKTNEDGRPTTVKVNKDTNCAEVLTCLQEEAPCSSISSANKNSTLTSVPLRSSCSLREFIPSIKEVTTQDKTNESFLTIEKQNQKSEKEDCKQEGQINGTSKASRLENCNASHVNLVQGENRHDLNYGFPADEMQGNQTYPRHVSVHVLDGKLGACTQIPFHDISFQDSLFHPMGGVDEQPKLFSNSAASETSENQTNTKRSSIHQSFPSYPPFKPVLHSQNDYQSFLNISSTFSSLVVSTLMQNSAAHAAASFAATLWPYANEETSSDAHASSQRGFPSRQMGSHPSMAAIAAATVAAATAWWTAHGLLPLCAPLHTAFTCAPTSETAVPSMETGQAPADKTGKGESTPQNPPLQDQVLDPEFLEALQAPHSASKSPVISSSDSDVIGGEKLNTTSNVMDHENTATTEQQHDSNKKGKKQVDRSSCGSNTASSSEVETDALEKDVKGKEELKEPENHLASESSNRRCRSSNNITESWKEVSEEGRVAFRALFSRGVLPQSFSPPHYLKNKDSFMLDLNSTKCSYGHDGVETNMSLAGNNEEGVLTIGLGLGPGKLKACRTGFKPYKRCSEVAKENRIGNSSNQGEEKGPKRIRLGGEAST